MTNEFRNLWCARIFEFALPFALEQGDEIKIVVPLEAQLTWRLEILTHGWGEPHGNFSIKRQHFVGSFEQIARLQSRIAIWRSINSRIYVKITVDPKIFQNLHQNWRAAIIYFRLIYSSQRFEWGKNGTQLTNQNQETSKFLMKRKIL